MSYANFALELAGHDQGKTNESAGCGVYVPHPTDSPPPTPSEAHSLASKRAHYPRPANRSACANSRRIELDKSQRKHLSGLLSAVRQRKELRVNRESWGTVRVFLPELAFFGSRPSTFNAGSGSVAEGAPRCTGGRYRHATGRGRGNGRSGAIALHQAGSSQVRGSR